MIYPAESLVHKVIRRHPARARRVRRAAVLLAARRRARADHLRGRRRGRGLRPDRAGHDRRARGRRTRCTSSLSTWRREKLELAKECGADITINIAEEDAVADRQGPHRTATAPTSTWRAPAIPPRSRRASTCLRKLGRYVEYGVFGSDVTVDWSIISDDKELDVLGAHLGPYCWPAAIRMIESGVLPMDKICTHQLPLTEFQKGLDLVASGKESVKVSLIPGLMHEGQTESHEPRHRAADVAAKHAGGVGPGRCRRGRASRRCSACGVGGKASAAERCSESVTGGFDWKKASGSTINILQTPHPYQLSYQPLLKEFTELTGITVNVDLVPEADYFTKLNTELAGGSGKHDVFMLGAYFIWQYGPPGWIEDLDPWLKNSSATSRTTTSRTSSTGLRTSTRWDFTLGNPLGTGGQWAIPWGFENNVVAYNKALLRRRRASSKLPDTLDDFIQLAVDLTDRSQNRYGIATRGSKSWATIHPGFMTQYTREGAVDYTFNGSELIAEMDSDKAIEFTEKWIEMQHKAGPTSWTTYDYPNATGDLGDGKAMMVYDADSATYPKNKPGASKEAGNLAWHPGPAGRRRQLQDQPVDLVAGR